jgi:hypothetical protein
MEVANNEKPLHAVQSGKIHDLSIEDNRPWIKAALVR